MISLNINKRGQQVEATGIRSRASSIYVPGQSEPFRISRSKFNDFLSCKKCFYLDRVKGLRSPSTPGWTLNETTDLLLKKEFDICRVRQEPHRIFSEYGLLNVVPFMHPDIDRWRDSLHHGISHQISGTNIILHGGIDDIWHDLSRDELIIADYKSQANKYPVTTKYYLDNIYHQSYKIQMDVYAYILGNMGFKISETSYFYVCNADRNAEAFSGRMMFEETLVPYIWDASWVGEKLVEMLNVLNSTELPEENPACENCAYANQRTVLA